MKAPFPYFGGKSLISSRVWELLGNPDHYMEPFFGSGAVLLSRKDWIGKTETVCDKDGFLANVWRGIKLYPDETAKWCDWPVNHADLMARRKELIKNEALLLESLIDDPEWCDPKLAGYWIWAASCWIGSGLTKASGSENCQRPHIGSKGVGVNKCQIPQISNTGMGVIINSDIHAWFDALSGRLRRVRVVCGDFMRILGGNWQGDKWKNVGIFFDPPYGDTNRDVGIYHHDGTDIAERVEKWCLERTGLQNHKIVLCGYDGEYKALLEAGWKSEKWKANGGYSNASKGKNRNKYRETLFYTPNCEAGPVQGSLFG